MKCISCDLEMTERRMLLACALTSGELTIFGPDSGGTSSEVVVPIERHDFVADEIIWCSADCFAHWVANHFAQEATS